MVMDNDSVARSDLLLNLVKSSTQGDKNLFRQTLEALIAEERNKQHHVLADRLLECASTLNGSFMKPTLSNDNNLQSLLFEVLPKKSFDDLLLPDIVRDACREVVEEHQRAELLRSYSIEPRHKILFAGPPGNGKTSLAEGLAFALMYPLIVVRYEGIIGSYLGETAVRLRKIFDFVRSRQCVLFFDEFDTVGKERGDLHETGEIKRVVSSLLLQIDELPSHVVVVVATNHPELLDRAVWRRFQVRVSLPAPSQQAIVKYIEMFQQKLKVSLNYEIEKIAEKLKDVSFAEVEDFCNDIHRQYVLQASNANLKKIIDDRLAYWRARFCIISNDRRQTK